MSYDVFGKPRDGDTWIQSDYPELDFNSGGDIEITKRGFTGHEHLDNFELIHMNGRMYDFNNGRFLSVDPFIQGVTSQAINPYSYIQNNPLSGVDPTGYQMKCERFDCPGENGAPGGPFPGSREWLRNKYSLNSNGSGNTVEEAKKDADNNADLMEQSELFLQDWDKRSLNDKFADGTFMEPDPNGFREYFPPPLLFDLVGDTIASFRDDRLNPITNTYISEGEVFDNRFMLFIDIGTAGIGSRVKAAGKVADDVITETVLLSKNRFPESSQHILDAQSSGHPKVLTVARSNAKANRRESLRGIETKPNLDRDEYPMAMFKEGGKGASVRHINPGDNRGAGACLGAQCRKLPDGTKVKIKVINEK